MSRDRGRGERSKWTDADRAALERQWKEDAEAVVREQAQRAREAAQQSQVRQQAARESCEGAETIARNQLVNKEAEELPERIVRLNMRTWGNRVRNLGEAIARGVLVSTERIERLCIMEDKERLCLEDIVGQGLQNIERVARKEMSSTEVVETLMVLPRFGEGNAAAEIYQLQEIMTRYGFVDMTAREALTSGFAELFSAVDGGNVVQGVEKPSIWQVPKELASIQRLRNALQEMDGDVAPIRWLLERCQLSIHGTAMCANILNAAIDTARFYRNRTTENVMTAWISMGSTIVIVFGCYEVYVGFCFVRVIDRYQREGILKAAEEALTSVAFLLAPRALTYTYVGRYPYISLYYTVGIAAISIGRMMYNAYSLYQEVGQETLNQEMKDYESVQVMEVEEKISEEEKELTKENREDIEEKENIPTEESTYTYSLSSDKTQSKEGESDVKGTELSNSFFDFTGNGLWLGLLLGIGGTFLWETWGVNRRHSILGSIAMISMTGCWLYGCPNLSSLKEALKLGLKQLDVLKEDRELLRGAGQSKDPEAQLALARVYAEGGNMEETVEETKKRFEAGRKESTKVNLDKKSIIERRMEATEIRLKYSAEQGNSKAQYELATLYEEIGKIKDAKKWYLKAAERGDAYAQYEVSRLCYKEGDKKCEKKWVQEAAKRGHIEAQNNFGWIYKEEGDEDNAIEWLLKSADKGYIRAKINLNIIYQEIGDIEQAKKWLLSAAEQEDLRAQHELALLCYREKDEECLLKWYHEAANQGFSLSQDNLCKYYYEHNDIEKAIEWGQKASAQGLTECLNAIEGKM